MPPSRRKVLQIGGAALTIGLAGCTQTIASGTTYRDSTGWPMANHDAANTKYQPHSSGLTERPDITWTVNVRPTAQPDPPYTEARSTTPPAPIVSDGTVYVGGEGLFAIDAVDGSIQWRAIEEEMVFGPAIVDETVYVSSITTDQTGYIRAFSTTDGATDWTTTYDRQLRCLRFAPLVATGERLCVTISTNESSAWPPDEGRLLTLDRATGNRLWQRDAARQMDRAASPGVVDGTVFAGGPDNWHLQAIGPTCNLGCQYLGDPPSRQWVSNEGWYYPMTAPVVTDETIYTGGWGHHWKAHSGSSYNSFSAFSRTDGTRRWQRQIGDQVTSPAVKGDSRYVAATRSTGTEPYEDIEAVRIETDVDIVSFDTSGTEQWTQTLTDRRVWADPVCTENVVYVATYASQTADAAPALHAFDTQTGTRLWDRELPTIVTALAIAGERLYASGRDGIVMALE